MSCNLNASDVLFLYESRESEAQFGECTPFKSTDPARVPMMNFRSVRWSNKEGRTLDRMSCSSSVLTFGKKKSKGLNGERRPGNSA